MLTRKLKRISLVGLCSISLGFTGVGCSSLSSSTSSSPNTSAEEFHEPTSLSLSDNGGYTMDDESADFGLSTMSQFGDDDALVATDLSASRSENEVEDDHNSEDDDSVEDEDGDNARRADYIIRVTWGNFSLNRGDDRDTSQSSTSWTDWSGSITLNTDQVTGLIDQKEIRIKKKILFDRHDHLLRDDDSDSIAWESHTGPHVDGLLIRVRLKMDSVNDLNTAINQAKVTLQTPQVTLDYTLAELAPLTELHTTNVSGEGLIITALRVDNNLCPQGFVDGKYFTREEGEGNIFRGRFLNEEGEMRGRLRGHHGRDDRGQSLFFGKEVTRYGLFNGILYGTFDDDSFEGTWKNESQDDLGTIHAAYVNGDDVDSGFFQGYWEENCSL